MIILEKMCSVYLCLFLSNVVLSAGIQYTEPNINYFITQGREQIIQNRFMSFKLKTCSTAYVLLWAVKLKVVFPYRIVIHDLNGELYSIRCGNIAYESRKPVLHCDIYTDLFITWDDYAITVTLGLESNGSVLKKISPLYLLPIYIFDIGLRTKYKGEWIFNTKDILFTPNEETMNRTATGDYLIPTGVTRHSQKTTIKDLSTLSIGTSIPSQRYTVTEILTMSSETTEGAETTTADDMPTTTDVMTTTSNDLLSTITNGDTKVSDTSAESASTTIPLELVTTPYSPSVDGTTYTEPSTSTCKCNCPKASVTPINNDLIDQLKIDKKTLSSYKRRRKSATDPRKSSFYIGCIGITVLVISVAFIVLLDCIPRA